MEFVVNYAGSEDGEQRQILVWNARGKKLMVTDFYWKGNLKSKTSAGALRRLQIHKFWPRFCILDRAQIADIICNFV